MVVTCACRATSTPLVNMWLTNDIERRRCPDEFAQRIAGAGGYNRYDEPNFKIIWGQTETFRAGGSWAGNGQPTYRGYRDLLMGAGEPCWMLVQWQSPEKYGRPESYYVFNFDEESGLQTLGEYPYSGRYEIVLSFSFKAKVRDRLVIEHMPLSSLLVDLVVPIIREAKELSYEKRRAIMREQKERADREQVTQIEDRLRDASPAFGTASRSSALLGECNSIVQKRAEAIEQHWKRALKELTLRGKGISVGKFR